MQSRTDEHGKHDDIVCRAPFLCMLATALMPMSVTALTAAAHGADGSWLGSQSLSDSTWWKALQAEKWLACKATGMCLG